MYGAFCIDLLKRQNGISYQSLFSLYQSLLFCLFFLFILFVEEYRDIHACQRKIYLLLYGKFKTFERRHFNLFFGDSNHEIGYQINI